VHRAAGQLLNNDSTYKIVFNPNDPGANGQACNFSSGLNCTPYVDINNNGWDTSDPSLLSYKPALDALTGGLLYVASTQYFANMRDQMDRADHLMKTKTPIVGFLGVVSSTYEAEYVNGTAFSVLPGGLLIDMKGITIGGSYRRNDTPITYSNRQFEFIGHITSSLEHETWQELTGYDAVSTVRGIQMALANGTTTLLDVQNNPGTNTNTLPAFYTATGFAATAPAPFTLVQQTIYSTKPNSWSNPTTTATQGFDVIKKLPATTTDSRLGRLTYYNDFWNGNLGCFSSVQNQLNSLQATYGASAGLNAATACGVSWSAGTTIGSAIALMQTGYKNYIGGNNAAFFNYLDAAQGFLNSDFVYRNTALAANAYSSSWVQSIRNDILLSYSPTQNWVDYTLPSTLVYGPNNRFQVDIRRVFTTSTGRLASISFEIQNLGK
jgi:hypothetical protein